ncbi:MAG TPA: type II toxin-antitoxin system HicB family antitoxin [Pyrinomonadaceae bacterium]|nr:type II toxin-antitoxin system HicB family antitoxin [Pyrinomonadaceae bacterium]
MKTFTAVVEKCADTGLFVGYVPGFPGAHTQGASLEELNQNLKEVIEMLLEDGEPALNSEFVGTQTVMISGNGQISGSQT